MAHVVDHRKFDVSQEVIDGHLETLEAGTESAGESSKRADAWASAAVSSLLGRLTALTPRRFRSFCTYVRFTPLEALNCATKTGAEIMVRADEIGTLEEGKLADLLVVDGDVLSDMRLLENHSNFLAVIQGGVVNAGKLASGDAQR